jgi:hypothetical protein
MIAALFALAAAMVIGGCAAVIQGFPYVRLESGLAMVIAGAVAASAGAILGGLGVLALGLRRVELAIGRDPAREAAESAPAPAGEGRSRLPPVLPAAPAFLVPSVVEPSFDPERPRLDPAPDLRGEEPPIPVTPVAVAAPSKPAPPISAPPMSAPPMSAPPVSVSPKPDTPMPRAVAPEDDLFAAPAGPPQPKDGPTLRSSLDPAPIPAPKPATRTVVGRYASGGNTYVMFEDGSIEAETPQGRFTFASLDELKAFVDGGGESGTRGAA